MLSSIQEAFVAGTDTCGHQKSMERKLEVGSGGHCGEKQSVSHIVDSCPQTKLNVGLSQLHSVDDEAVAWLTTNGS